MEEKVIIPRYSELGSIGLNRWGQNVHEEFLTNLRWPRAGRLYKEMSSNDPVITAILLCARQLIRKVTWRVKPASDKRVDIKAAEFLESCLRDMSSTWGDIVDEVTSYFEYGWSYHEIVYKKRSGVQKDPSQRSKFDDGRIGWRKISGRSQESWDGWEFDEKDDGSLRGMWQSDNNNTKKIMIPIQKALLFRTTVARGNPEGRSFLRGAYRPWYFKKHIEEIEGIGIERDLAGLPVLKTPEGLDLWDSSNEMAVTAKRNAETLVKGIRRDKNEGIVLPFGWELTLLSSASNRQFDTNAIINRYDQRIAITLLADIVMLGADKVGSFALANVKKSLLAAALDAQVQSIAGVMNRHAVPRLFDLNTFTGLSGLPELQASPVDTPELKELGEYIGKLAGAKMPLFPDMDLENYLRGLANFPKVDETEEAREATLEHSKGAKPPQTNAGEADAESDNKDGTEPSA